MGKTIIAIAAKEFEPQINQDYKAKTLDVMINS